MDRAKFGSESLSAVKNQKLLLARKISRVNKPKRSWFLHLKLFLLGIPKRFALCVLKSYITFQMSRGYWRLSGQFVQGGRKVL
jgi:hypothetical protein